MDIDEVEAGSRSPMAKETRFNVFHGQGLFQERVVQEVNLPHGKVVGGAPVGVHEVESFIGESSCRCGHDGFLSVRELNKRKCTVFCLPRKAI
jgi:hypothetical protein